jgi:hypothetical protein
VARSRHIIPLDKAEASALWNFISGCLPLVRLNQRTLSRLLHLPLAYTATSLSVFPFSRPFYHFSAARFVLPCASDVCFPLATRTLPPETFLSPPSPRSRLPLPFSLRRRSHPRQLPLQPQHRPTPRAAQLAHFTPFRRLLQQRLQPRQTRL